MGKKKSKRRSGRPGRQSLAERKAAPKGLQKVAAKLVGCARWPVIECLINTNWRDTSAASILLTRRRPDGGTAAAVFFVDLGCLGIKWALIEPNITEERLDTIAQVTDMGEGNEACDPDLAARIVETGYEYARSLGFSPMDKSFPATRLMLKGLEPERSVEEVICGRDGQPLYVSGPDDDVEAILQHLEARFGSDGYHFVAEGGFT